MFRIGWFSTGRDEAARGLLCTVQEAIKRGEIEGEIAFVFSNWEPGEARESDLFSQLVRGYQIPLICLSSRRFRPIAKKRQVYDREVMRRLENSPFELGVLAGYMLIVGEEMCRRFPLINLHPAPPGGPTGTWQEVIWKLIESRATRSGVMMHQVTPELDRGPVVTYCTFSLRGEPWDRYWKGLERGEDSQALFQLIRQEGIKRELPLLVATLKAFSQGRARVERGRVVDGQGRPISGYDLTAEIEAALSRC